MAQVEESLTVEQLADLIRQRVKTLLQRGDIHPRFLVAWVNSELGHESEKLVYREGTFVVARVACDSCGTSLAHDPIGPFCPRCQTG